MNNEPEPEEFDGDCTIPPDQPVPADQLAQYSPDRDYHAEREIADYVEETVHDETVQHVEEELSIPVDRLVSGDLRSS